MFPGLQQELPTEETLQSSKLSLMTSENSCSPWYLNPLSGSSCTCRRSPRLLTNGYYDLSEESFVDEEGNLTFIPSKINISYKENLVRIFRRKKKVRRSLASLFSIDSSSSWLNNSLFSGIDCPLAESSWIDGGNDFDSNFRSDQERSSVDASPNGKSWLSEENLPVIDTESYTQESLLTNKSTGGHFRLPSHLPLHPTKCFLNNMLGGPDAANPVEFLQHSLCFLKKCAVDWNYCWWKIGVWSHCDVLSERFNDCQEFIFPSDHLDPFNMCRRVCKLVSCRNGCCFTYNYAGVCSCAVHGKICISLLS